MSSLSLLADTTWYPITFDSPLNIMRGVFFWVAIALAAAFLVCVCILKGERRKTFLWYALLVAASYACIVGIVLLQLSFAEDGIAALLFYPLLVLLLCIAGAGVAVALKPTKPVLIAAGCVVGAAAIAVLVCMGVHFANGGSLWLNWIVDETEENVDPSKVNRIGLYISAAVAVIALAAATFLLGRKDKKGFDSKSLSYAAVCIAMSYALSYLRLVKMPQGGSITIASLVPLMVYSYMFGVKKGVAAGLIYGVLQAFQDLYILHPAQFLLDYPIAFACIGLAGMFAKTKWLKKLPQLQIALGGIVAGLSRFVMHYLSGCFAFGMWAPEGQPVWLYSLIYQSAYVLPDIAIAIVVCVFIFCSPSFVKMARRFNQPAPAKTVAQDEAPMSEVAVTESANEAPMPEVAAAESANGAPTSESAPAPEAPKED